MASTYSHCRRDCCDRPVSLGSIRSAETRSFEEGTMRSLVFVPALSIILAFLSHAAQAPAPSFTVEQILGFPAPENLVASPVGSAVAGAFNERGVRNVYVAEGPDFTAQRVTSDRGDDGQGSTLHSFSRAGQNTVYVRGG